MMLGIVEQQRPIPILRRHWRAFMHSTQDLGLQRIVEAVGKTLEALKKALPELEPVSAMGGEPAAFGVSSPPTIPKIFTEAVGHITLR